MIGSRIRARRGSLGGGPPAVAASDPGATGAESAEVIEGDVLGLHSQVVEHLLHGVVHHRRTAEVVLAILAV
jgi:hypothetical protein